MLQGRFDTRCAWVGSRPNGRTTSPRNLLTAEPVPLERLLRKTRQVPLRRDGTLLALCI